VSEGKVELGEDVPESEVPQLSDQDKPSRYEQSEQRITAEMDGKAEVPEIKPKDSISTAHSAGLTGWADAARGGKPKPAQHGSSVQYSHAKSSQAGERRSAASARRQPQQHRNPPRYRAAPVPMTEFDFEKANSLFDKAKIKQELLRGAPETPESQGAEPGSAVTTPSLPTKSYDKTASFFDSLSCDSLTEDGDGGKRSYAEQRRLNAETFGVQSLNDGRSHRGQSDRGGTRQYQRRQNGAQGGNYTNRPHPTKRVFVPVHGDSGHKPEPGKK